VVESMGSEVYAYFDLATQGAESQQLEELARDAQLEDLPKHGDGAMTVVARLDPASKAAAGAELDLVLESEEIKLFDPQDGTSLTH
jgi:multiple sugar transport system ATP-binding protein